MNNQTAGGTQLRKILGLIEVCHSLGTVKNGPNRGKKGELNGEAFSDAKRIFDKAFNAGLDQRFGNIDVIMSICSLMIHSNEKRSRQFAIAVTNAVMDTHHPRIVGERLVATIRRFQQTSHPQLMASGVENFIDKLCERVEKYYATKKVA